MSPRRDEDPAHRRARPKRRRVRMLLIAVAAVVAAVALTVGPRLVGDMLEQRSLAEFARQPADAKDGDPGTIVRSERLEGRPAGADAWRIMYRTTDLNGDAVVATAIVVAPQDLAPEGGRTVLAWGHPTTGTAEECAPSRSFDPYIGIEGMRIMLDRGYTVVAPDYVGMGTEGPDSYLIGVTAGNSLLDAVRAAQALPDAQAGDSVILWGHSQGGQAVIFAAERAQQYAPELEILAVAAAAPAADLSVLMESHLDDVSGVTIGSYAFQAYSEVYADRGADLDLLITPEAQQILPRMNELCLLTHLSELHGIAAPVIGDFVSANPTGVEPWATLLRENSAGGAAFSAPLFVAQGLQDRLVLPEDTQEFVDGERSLGIDVSYHRIEVADHGTVAYLALPALSGWLDSLKV